MIDLPLKIIQDYCQAHPIQKLSVFGSALRDDFHAESDIDLLVQFIPNVPITLLDIIGMETELSDLVGKSVDLRTPNELSRYFREDVIKEAVLVYERPE
ncbi:MAG: nucleotidyltransferase family protein [Anaerolineae bacterium]|nr:nucleotidyltransferase family protein [Anaerolineae bacterium]